MCTMLLCTSLVSFGSDEATTNKDPGDITYVDINNAVDAPAVFVLTPDTKYSAEFGDDYIDYNVSVTKDSYTITTSEIYGDVPIDPGNCYCIVSNNSTDTGSYIDHDEQTKRSAYTYADLAGSDSKSKVLYNQLE